MMGYCIVFGKSQPRTGVGVNIYLLELSQVEVY